MNRPRACAAVIKDDKILMVCHQTSSRTYWTFPGGGVNEGELFEQAAVREVKEETGLDVRVVRLLFEEDYEFGISYCYLAEVIGQNTKLTLDFLPDEESIFGTMLHFAEWHSIKDQKNDIQVSKVITLLGLNVDEPSP